MFCSLMQTGKFASDDVEVQTEQVNSLLTFLITHQHMLVTPSYCILQILKNMGEILTSGGASYASVVKTTILYEWFVLSLVQLCIWVVARCRRLISFISSRLADLKDFKKVNDIYAKCEYVSHARESFYVNTLLTMRFKWFQTFLHLPRLARLIR